MPGAPTFKQIRPDVEAATVDRELRSALDLIKVVVEKLPVLEELLERSSPQGTMALQDAAAVEIEGGSVEVETCKVSARPVEATDVLRLEDNLRLRNSVYGLVKIKC